MSQFNRCDFLKALAVAAPASVLHIPNARAASKAKVVVIRGGFGGAAAAKYLKMMSPTLDVTLVEKNKIYVSCPLSNEVISGHSNLQHWTVYESHHHLLSSFSFLHHDIKFLWDPARFGFAFTLGRASHLTQDEKYAAAFWHYFEIFTAANPPYLGLHWMNGQEVALRLMAFVWAGQVFAASTHSTPARLAALTGSIAFHASRIPPTLIYARSQNNNHLLTEAAGLYTAGLALPTHPDAKRWRALGWKWLVWCFKKRIDSSGEYVQQLIPH